MKNEEFCIQNAEFCRTAPASRKYGDHPTNGCRHDTTYNDNYWGQQVSGGFYYNATSKEEPWAPGWTAQKWSEPSTGVVHMYHSARWGGWQFELAARNDTDHSLDFKCTPLEQQEDGFYGVAGVAVPCSTIPDAPGSKETSGAVTAGKDRGGARGGKGGGRGGGRGNAVVHGGWQEGRGGDIGPRYTNRALNNSYFIENIKVAICIEMEFCTKNDDSCIKNDDFNGISRRSWTWRGSGFSISRRVRST